MAWNRPNSEGGNQSANRAGDKSKNRKIEKSTNRRAARRSAPTWVRGLIAAGIVVVGAAIAWYFIGGEEPAKHEARSTKHVGLIEEVKSAAAGPAKSAERVEESAAKAKAPVSNIYTNRYGNEVRVEKDGTKVAMLKGWQEKREWEEKHPQKRVFKNGVEAYLSMFLTPGQAVPPPPVNYTDADAQAMLLNKIEFEDDDTEDERREKEGVIAMKEQLREWIKEGGDFDGFMREVQHRQELETTKMFEARKMITEELEKGNVEEARELYDAINKHFADQSMPKVNVAPKYRRILTNRE